MNFQTFKKQWSDAMVFKPDEFDFETTMHELYIEFKDDLQTYGKNFTVKQWCEFFHQECNLDQHPYMLKNKHGK